MPSTPSFIALDVETTGLDPAQGHRIVEIALIRYRGDKILESYETLIHPHRPIPGDAFAIHGISDADVIDAPSFHEVAGDIIAFIGMDPIIAHNAPFDLKFLQHELAATTYPHAVLRKNPAICTMRLACWLGLTRRWPRLERLIEILDLTVKPAHRAASDAVAAGTAFLRMWKLLRPLEFELHELPELMRLHRSVHELLARNTAPMPD